MADAKKRIDWMEDVAVTEVNYKGYACRYTDEPIRMGTCACCKRENVKINGMAIEGMCGACGFIACRAFVFRQNGAPATAIVHPLKLRKALEVLFREPTNEKGSAITPGGLKRNCKKFYKE